MSCHVLTYGVQSTDNSDSVEPGRNTQIGCLLWFSDFVHRMTVTSYGSVGDAGGHPSDLESAGVDHDNSESSLV